MQNTFDAVQHLSSWLCDAARKEINRWCRVFGPGLKNWIEHQQKTTKPKESHTWLRSFCCSSIQYWTCSGKKKVHSSCISLLSVINKPIENACECVSTHRLKLVKVEMNVLVVYVLNYLLRISLYIGNSQQWITSFKRSSCPVLRSSFEVQVDITYAEKSFTITIYIYI